MIVCLKMYGFGLLTKCVHHFVHKRNTLLYSFPMNTEHAQVT